MTSGAADAHPSRLDVPGRFEPGHRLGKRYRIVALIGRGGMGEVYRADDLELGQSVALKFLPERISSNPEALQRFRNEVRTARQVTHPNVCRIHDIAEEDGHVFLIMEHVDGEDLDSLLRRIGRPSRDKAVEIARQLCSGVAAAHQAGVLHRDLKPGNVMLDGRGRVRITDFGLAGLAKDLERRAGIDGTPAYMAPEQLAGRGVSTRSDVYSLGLVLYELFTGKRAHVGRTLAELRQEHESGSITSASTHAQDLDPAIERVIERCLEKDPARRPSSAQAVLRALPGGDPLAEAIAAGETPSPELIAHAGEAGSLSPRVAIGGFAAIVAALLVAWLVLPSGKPGETLRVPDQPPAVLAVRADDVLRSLGWEELLSGHAASGLLPDPELAKSVTATDAPERAARRGPGTSFWRRWSEEPLRPNEFHQPAVTMHDPPVSMPGQAVVVLDDSSRLAGLMIFPQMKEMEPDRATSPAPAESASPAGPSAASPAPPDPGPSDAAPAADPPPDWSRLFELARLDIGKYRAIAPSRGRAGLVPTDVQAAWEGPDPEDPARTLTLSAGARAGRIVAWEIDWRLEQDSPPPSPASSPPQFGTWMGIVVSAFAAFLALRHVRSGRGDRRGAARLGAFVTAMYWIGGWVLFLPQHDRLADVIAGSYFGEHLGHALVHGVAMTVFYLALEPYARRLWPRMLVAWSRLLQGRLTDPLVGRELLLGGAACAVMLLVTAGIERIAVGTGLSHWAPPSPLAYMSIGSPGSWAFDLLLGPPRAILGALSLTMPLLVFRILLRNSAAAVVLTLVVNVVPIQAQSLDPTQPLLTLALAIVAAALGIAVLLRGGLIAFTMFLWCSATFSSIVPAAAAGSWARTPQLVVLAIIFAVLAVGAWISLAGRPILGDLLAEKPDGA